MSLHCQADSYPLCHQGIPFLPYPHFLVLTSGTDQWRLPMIGAQICAVWSPSYPLRVVPTI